MYAGEIWLASNLIDYPTASVAYVTTKYRYHDPERNCDVWEFEAFPSINGGKSVVVCMNNKDVVRKCWRYHESR